MVQSILGAILMCSGISTSTITISKNSVIRSFQPDSFFGAALDGGDRGFVKRIYRPGNLKAMSSAGFQSVTYRLRTELACESWHWNPQGTWSDQQHLEGYWTSSSEAAKPINISWGYRLPRRGNTFDQANNDGFSRLDDGDITSYWKSNPYLDSAYSGSLKKMPEWVVVDLKSHVPVNGMCINWANPYATQYYVQYWQGEENFEADDNPEGSWMNFGVGLRSGAKGGREELKFARTKKVRFIRILLFASSHTSESLNPIDKRDRMGFAIREIQIGEWRNGHLADAVSHLPNNTQTPIYTSSTDPWHRHTDLDVDTEQPGLDLVYESGLTSGNPMLIPVPVLFDTPENAESEVRWLKARNYKLRGLELGEEPDGQCVDPQSYAQLYISLAKRLKAIDSTLLTGGPGLQSVPDTFGMWPDNRPTSWTSRFIHSLKAANSLADLGFFSFEWYPSDKPYGNPRNDLKSNFHLLASALTQLKKDGLTSAIPWYITEYGYSAFSGPLEVEIPDAILNLDTIGSSLELGGSAAFLYGFEPGELGSDYGDRWGDLMTWLADKEGNAKYPMPSYWAAKMMNEDWCQAKGVHRLLRSICTDPSLSVYSLLRPDDSVSVLLLNKDPDRLHRVQLKVGKELKVSGSVAQFARGNYEWKADAENGHPVRDEAPTRKQFNGVVDLPPYSITVVQLKGN